MKNILVLGGAGYIGSHTVKRLLIKGYNPIVVDNLIYGHKEAVLARDFYQIDIGDRLALNSVFKKYKIDAVVHFAAFAYVGESVKSPQKYYQNNLINTINVLDCMLENNVKNIVFSSTCATYGNPQYSPLDEKHPQNPINPYGWTKFMVEKVMEDYEHAYGLKSICLRYFNAAGADKDGELCEKHNPETHLIPLVLQVALGEREYISVFGNDYDTPDGTCIRDYIHVEDLAEAHILAIEKLISEGKSYRINLGTGIGTSVNEIIEAAKRVSGKEIPVLYVDRREGDPPKLVASNAYAQDVLYWVPQYTNIDDIVRSAYKVMLNPPF